MLKYMVSLFACFSPFSYCIALLLTAEWQDQRSECYHVVIPLLPYPFHSSVMGCDLAQLGSSCYNVYARTSVEVKSES